MEGQEGQREGQAAGVGGEGRGQRKERAGCWEQGGWSGVEVQAAD